MEHGVKHQRKLIASPSGVSSFFADIEAGIGDQVGWDLSGNTFNIDPQTMIEMILDVAELHDRGVDKPWARKADAPPRVQFSGSSDGGAITDTKGMIMQGLKLADEVLINRTVRHTHGEKAALCAEDFDGIQSSRCVAYSGLYIGDDNKETNSQLSYDFFHWVEGLTNVGHFQHSRTKK
jgi:hypothetical protein